MPTPEEIRAAHPEIFGPAQAPPVQAPGVGGGDADTERMLAGAKAALAGANQFAQTTGGNAHTERPEDYTPTMLDRVKGLIARHPTLTRLGVTGGAALVAPEAVIPAMLMGAGANAGAGLLNSWASDTPESATSLGVDAALGAGEGAVPAALNKGGSAARKLATRLKAFRDGVEVPTTNAAGDVVGSTTKGGIPAAKRVAGYATEAAFGHPAAAAATAAGVELGPETLGGLGSLAQKGSAAWRAAQQAVKGKLGWTAAEEDIPSVSPVVRRAQAQARQATGESTQVPYRAGGAPSNNVRYVDPEGTVRPYPYSPRPAPIAPVKDPLGSVNDMVTNQHGIDWMHSEFEQNKPIADSIFGAKNGAQPPSSYTSLMDTSGETGRGVTSSVASKLANQQTPGWTDVDLSGMGSGSSVEGSGVKPPYGEPGEGATPSSGSGETADDIERQAAAEWDQHVNGKGGGYRAYNSDSSVPSIQNLGELADYVARMRAGR